MSDTRLPVTRYIVEHIATFGWPPSLEEICKGLGVASKSTAMERLNEAAAAGEIVRGDKPRQIKVVDR